MIIANMLSKCCNIIDAMCSLNVAQYIANILSNYCQYIAQYLASLTIDSICSIFIVFLKPSPENPSDFPPLRAVVSQVWPDRAEHLFLGAEGGGWQEKGEVRDLVSPRTRPHPSHIPSSPPPLTTLTPACHVRRPRRRAALCATLVVKELYYIRPMASGQLIDASKTYFRPFLRTCACGLRVFSSV